MPEAQDTAPRVLVININPSSSELDGCNAIAAMMRRLGAIITIEHWTQTGGLDPAWMGIILGPNGTPFEAYPEGFQSFLSWVRELRLPVLGICGGHQALALAHGGRLGSVFSPDKPTLSYDGFSKLSGSIDIETLVESPLTEGLPPVFQVQASHVEEVKHLPSPFTAIFSHQHSPIQGFSNAARHHYGVQFHPERSASGTPPVRLLQNWLAIASDAFKSRE